ncbi:MAG: acylphosphatase [Nitrospiria bacterium]
MSTERNLARSVAAHIFVSGIVQGVGFRYFTQDHASARGLVGTTRNLSDGRVEVEVEGEQGRIEDLIRDLRKGPAGSKVDAVDVSWGSPSSRFSDFSITPSP